MAVKFMTTHDLALPFFTVFKYCGCDPRYSGILARFIFWLFIITDFIFMISTAIKCVQQDSLPTFVKSSIDFIIASQTGIKGLFFYIHKDKISDILNVFQNEFWPVDKIPYLAAIHNDVYRRSMSNLKVYRFILICCIIQISFFPVILFIRAEPYGFFFFGFEDTVLMKSPYFELIYAYECITISGSYALLLVNYDLIFIVLGGTVTVQFDMLKHVLLSVGDNEDDEDRAFEIIKESVAHHNMLLKFVEDLEQIVTIPILKQYLDAIACMGLLLYVLQLKFEFLYFFSLMTNLSQTLYFSIFGQLIQDKSSAVADAAYENNWQNLRNHKVRQALILIIQRAQRRSQITAGGFITLSFESFAGMVKTAASFLAVLRSTKEN